jgi:flavin-dependent dehydrogenase
MLDVLIIGAGPAGSTAARLLAEWGYQVAIATAPPPRNSMAECLPPSTRKVFQFLGIENAIEAAGFYRTAGNTVWWGGSSRRVEPYASGFGYQVLRRDFDALLLDLARSAGAQIGGERPDARFVLDCSGRAGVLARSYRVKAKNSRTVALCGVWRSDRGWKLPDASHTLVEAYEDGWAWSVPLSPEVRHIAFMVDPAATKMVREQGLARAYAAQMEKTRVFRRIFAHSVLECAPWGRDASPYTSRQFSAPGLLLVGDAGSTIDPLSSFGIKKAMVSAWAAAVVVNTCLRRPEMQAAALGYFDARERQVYEGYRKQSSDWARAASDGAQPFWSLRSDVEQAEDKDGAGDRAALAALRKKASIRLRPAEGVAMERKPGIEGREVVLREALNAPGLAEPIDFIANVNAPKLLEIAPSCAQVPDLFEAYNRIAPPVALPHFLAALSRLLATGILVSG